MKNLLFVLLYSCIYTFLFPCSCPPPTLENSYKYSKIIFVGKYLDQIEMGGPYGFPIKLDRFEVFNFFKGAKLDNAAITRINKKLFNKDKLISTLYSSSGSGCGFQFKTGKYYLIFAYPAYDYGYITTDGCIGTHEIPKENLDTYVLSEKLNKDMLYLNSLSKVDTIGNFEITKFEEPIQYLPAGLLEDATIKYESILKQRNILIAISIGLILILSLVLIRKRK
jgi:hypothetical protein